MLPLISADRQTGLCRSETDLVLKMQAAREKLKKLGMPVALPIVGFLLSRDSRLDQRKGRSLLVQFLGRFVDGRVEGVGVREGLMGEVVSLEVTPDCFNVVQFRSVFRQPLDGQPMRAGGERGARQLAGMDRAIVLDQYHRLSGLARLRSIEPVQLLKMGNEVAASLGRAGMHDEFACAVIA
jgi:hypothetical protein